MSKPKKGVLLVNLKEPRSGLWAYLLLNRGYRVAQVRSAGDAVQAIKAAGRQRYELVIALDGLTSTYLVRTLREIWGQDAPRVILCTQAEAAAVSDELMADAWLRGEEMSSSAAMLGKVRALLTQKRGPKPKVAAMEVAA